MNELKVKGQQRRTLDDNRDDIDLRFIFEKIGHGANRVQSGASYIISLAFRYALHILGITLLCIGLGYAYHKIQRPYYTSSMTLMLNNIRNEFVHDHLRSLTDLIEDGNQEILASRLDIPIDVAAEIRSMIFSNVDEERITEDSVLVGAPFRIELTLYNNRYFATMEPAITNYLENNPFFSKQKQIREIQVRKLISKLRNDIGSIDTVKSNLISPRGPISGFVYGEALDPTNLYRESINMYKEQVILESDLDRLDNIEVINGFVPRLKPSGPKLMYYLAVAGIIGLLLGFIVANKLENRKRAAV